MSALTSSWSRVPAKLRESLQLLVAMGILFGLYRLFRIPIEEGLRRADFHDAFFLGSALIKSLAKPFFWLGIVLAGATAFSSRHLKSWKDLAPGTSLEWMIWFTIGISAWTTSLYPFNYYYGQSHLLDRLIILGLGIGAIRRPLLLPFFTVAVLICFKQWKLPFGDPEWTNRKPFFDLLVLLNAILLTVGWKKFPRRSFFLALGALIIIHYWIPGLAKFDVRGQKSWDWLTENQTLNMMISGTTLGWNVLWNLDGAIKIWQAMAWSGLLMKLFVLVVELALIVSFWNRKVFLAFTLGRVLLHAGIFFFTGDTFWNWQLLGIGILLAFWPRKNRPENAIPESELFGWVPMIVTAIFVLVTANSWKASPLGWYDSRLSERYQVEVVTEGGERRILDPFFFEPYEFLFIQSIFHFLPESDKVAALTYGTVYDVATAKALRSASTPDDVRQVLKEHGKLYHDEKETEGLIDFLQTWTINYERIGETGLTKLLQFASPPPHALAYPAKENPYVPEEDGAILRYDLIFKRTWFDNETIHLMDREVRRSVEIPAGVSTPPAAP